MEERRDSGDKFGREMHKVKCSDCGKDTEVPFKPSGDRPVYCRDCYQKHRPPRRF
jgi:CxxC-x17-CxxC domain-containing protein